MTREQVLLVKSSFGALAPQRRRLAGLFFERLHKREPSLRRAFFGAEIRRESAWFDGLAAIVESLDRLHPIVPAIEWLALQGARRGIVPDHYPAIQGALLESLRAALGPRFTGEVEAAWRTAAGRITQVMAATFESRPLAA